MLRQGKTIREIQERRGQRLKDSSGNGGRPQTDVEVVQQAQRQRGWDLGEPPKMAL